MRRLLLILVTAVCATGLLAVFLPPTAKAAPWSPTNGIIFNNPMGRHTSEYAIVRHVNRAIDNAPRGSTISMAMYLFNQESTAWRLYRAHLRGVNVQMIVDDGEQSREIRYLRARLGQNKARRSFVISCKRSCMSNTAGSVLHSKIFTFSRVGRTPWVSMISSANLHDVNTTVSWNNLHTIAWNKRMYDSVRGYFVDMTRDRVNLNYWNTRRPLTSGKYTIFYYPRKAQKGKQTVDTLHALNNVSCRAGRGYGSGGRTVVRLAMWGWTGARMDVAKRAWRLKNAGCKVDVIINQGRISRAVLAQLLKRTKNGQIPVHNAWRDRNRNDYAELYVHHKAIAINGRVFKKNQRMVYTGSQNFTTTGTRLNDDIVLRVTDRGVYNAYSRNFSFIASRYAPRLRKMPKPIVLKKNANARGKFGGSVNPDDGLSAAERRLLEAEVERKTEASIDR